MTRTLRSLLAHAVLVTASAAIVLPLLWLLAASLTGRDPVEAAAGGLHLGNYAALLGGELGFPPWFWNSLVVALGSAAVTLPLATMLAHAVAWRGVGGAPLRLGLLAGWTVPSIALALPLSAVFLDASLLDARLAMAAAHVALNLPLTAWLLAALFPAGARRLEEAARLEGASRLGAFCRVAVPAAAPAIAAAGLLAFVLSWNEFLLALILSGRVTSTLPVGLSALATQDAGEVGTAAAAVVVASLPVLLLMPFLWRHLSESFGPARSIER